MKNYAILISMLVFITAFDLAARTTLALGHGAMEAGGSMQMPIHLQKGGGTMVGLHIQPSWAYFITRAFSLGFSPSVAKDNLTTEKAPWRFSVAAQGTFFFDLGGAIYPYVGASAGIEWWTKVEGIDFLLGIPVGVLVPLNNHVAIDFGVPIEFALNGDGYLGARLPIGYLGVRAFF